MPFRNCLSTNKQRQMVVSGLQTMIFLWGRNCKLDLPFLIILISFKITKPTLYHHLEEQRRRYFGFFFSPKPIVFYVVLVWVKTRAGFRGIYVMILGYCYRIDTWIYHRSGVEKSSYGDNSLKGCYTIMMFSCVGCKRGIVQWRNKWIKVQRELTKSKYVSVLVFYVVVK